jgi:ABC-2 type transport system permease protein
MQEPRRRRRKALCWQRAVNTMDIIWHCLRKDLMSALTDRVALFQMLILPLNYNMLLILFAFAGSAAPVAVVMPPDRGYYANAFYTAMQDSASFRLQVTDAATAQTLIAQGNVAAVVTLPADFDTQVSAGQPVQVRLLTNNLDTDMTDDVNRGLRLAVTTFYQQQFPGKVSIVASMNEAYTHETDYIPYLSVSVIIIGLLVGGVLQAGNAMARDWELQSIKEVLLAPAPRWAIIVGKMLAAGAVSLLSAVGVMLFLVFIIHDWPVHWAGTIGTIFFTSAVCVAAGTVLGNLLRHRQSVTLITRGSSVPLFFLSGVFNPITYATGGLVMLARLFPVHYAVALVQWGILNFRTNTLQPWQNALVLGGFLVGFLCLSSLVLRHGTVAH